ncbi:hypothetical protein BDV19DRAFT_373849 [Aspergillus venezuelensis]
MNLLNQVLLILVTLAAVADAGKPVTPGEPTDENPSPVKVNVCLVHDITSSSISPSKLCIDVGFCGHRSYGTSNASRIWRRT